MESWWRATCSGFRQINSPWRFTMTGKAQRKPRYFITHLPEEDRAPNYLRKERLPAFSIELRGSSGGLSGKRAYFDLDANEVLIEEHRVPANVVAAAKKLPTGDGGWFDDEGERAGLF